MLTSIYDNKPKVNNYFIVSEKLLPYIDFLDRGTYCFVSNVAVF